jgi:hypothetical protein
MTKHTPGLKHESWQYEEYMKQAFQDILNKEQASIKRLAEAAPELLEASQAVLRLWDNGGNPAGAFKALREAITKAEGREA